MDGGSGSTRPNTMECRLLGTLGGSDIGIVHELLRAMSHSAYERVAFHEIVLKDPTRPRAPTQIRLQRPLPPPGVKPVVEEEMLKEMTKSGDDRENWTWIMRHEGGPMRSSEATALPATIREVIESSLSGPRGTIESFWTMTMGLTLDHGLVRDGNLYRIEYEKQDIEVIICRLKRLPDPLKAENGRLLVSNAFVCEVIARATKDDFREAARAVGSFSERLKPFVKMSKAM